MRCPFAASFFVSAALPEQRRCARVVSAGVEIAFEPEARVLHHQDLTLEEFWRSLSPAGPSVTVTHVKHGSSGAHGPPRLDHALHYGMFRFYRKHYARQSNRLLNRAVYAGIALKLAASILRSGVSRGVGSRAIRRGRLQPGEGRNDGEDAERGEHVRVRGSRDEDRCDDRHDHRRVVRADARSAGEPSETHSKGVQDPA
jgi:hypothetical protein